MEEISKFLHEEYHEAEKRAMERLGVNIITQSQRAVGIVAYLSCCAVEEVHK